MFCFPKRQKAFPSKRWQAREIAKLHPATTVRPRISPVLRASRGDGTRGVQFSLLPCGAFFAHLICWFFQNQE